MSAGWKLEHTYCALPAAFYSKTSPTPVQGPSTVLFNHELALLLGLDPSIAEAQAPGWFSGNVLPEGAAPIAQAYAGHQFGHFTRLGDGRALLLGEQIDPSGSRWDIQLKGSGPTPYSRRGDGRAALGPMLREYLISEAMAALGIPTTRSLAVIATGEPVYRETPLSGAILTRVASSHIRVGTFEYAATLGTESVRALADYAIRRHFPDAAREPNPYVSLLARIIDRQARLIAQWMLVGFVHGVMNTDNMAISGETIDYGPCAFMDRYDPTTVFSSIDRNGRYAYGNQPEIAHWNLTRLAEALLPLLAENEPSSLEIAKNSLGNFGKSFSKAWIQGIHDKLGLFETIPEDESLIDELFQWMHRNQADFTNTFRFITAGKPAGQDADWARWEDRLKARRSLEKRSPAETHALMQRSNPILIPRNHHVEAALAAATEDHRLEPFHQLLSSLKRPFEDCPEHQDYLDPAPLEHGPYRTFCGT